MGKSSGSSPKIPKPPDIKKSYGEGANTYLDFLPKFLQAENDYRNAQDPLRIQHQQDLQDMFGTKQNSQILQSLQQLDPQWFNANNQAGQNVNNDLQNGYVNKGQANLYNGLLGSSGSLLSTTQNDLKSGTSLTPGQEQELEQETRRSQASRGNTYGQAPVQEEAFTKGKYGQELYQQRIANASGAIGAGGNVYNMQSPDQQVLSNALQYNQSNTPSQMAGSIAPVSPDRSMAYVNPNAGFQGQQFASQNYQNGVAAAVAGQGNSSNPWMSALGGVASIIGPIIGGLAFSDKRVKTGIQKVGKANGVGIYEFAYKGKPGMRMTGAIAQDVKKTRPDAVQTDPQSGLMKVDYRKLGLPMLPAPANSGDTHPAMLSDNEVVLNKGEQQKVGVHRILSAIGNRHGKPLGGGVRGFSEGGSTNDNSFDPSSWADPGPLPSPTPNPYGNPDPNVNINDYPHDWPTNYTPPPADGIPLVKPPGVNQPFNEQPPPPWMKFMPAFVKAGYGGYRLGQRLGDMIHNYQNDHPDGPSGLPDMPNGYDPFGGLPPGFTESNRFGHGAPSFTGPGDFGPNFSGGSIFNQTPGNRNGPLPGALFNLGASGGNLGRAGDIIGNTEFRHIMKFGQLPQDAFGANRGSWTPGLANFYQNHLANPFALLQGSNNGNLGGSGRPMTKDQ